MTKLFLLVPLIIGFGILTLIGLPGLIIHYVNKMRGNPAKQQKDTK